MGLRRIIGIVLLAASVAGIVTVFVVAEQPPIIETPLGPPSTGGNALVQWEAQVVDLSVNWSVASPLAVLGLVSLGAAALLLWPSRPKTLT